MEEGLRYRVATKDVVFFGIFWDRETCDGYPLLVFIDEAETHGNHVTAVAIPCHEILEVSRDDG